MQFNRDIFIFTIIAVFICLCSAVREDAADSDDVYKGTLPLFLNNRPRILSIFSKPPEPDAPKQTGPNILGHLGNVLHGGSIGVQLDFRPMAGIHGFIDHAKKFIPGGQTHPQVGQPEYQKPPPEPYDPPKGGNWESNEDEKDWIPENPVKPVPVGPSWEDIGEDPDDDPSIPYEEIINPRVRPQSRPKRSFLNSKIYHVPLTFRSNAKPYQVKFINSLTKKRDVEKSMNSVLRK